MKIKRCPIIFHNVISHKAVCRVDEWHLTARRLRNAIIQNGLYATGPIIYKVSNLNEETLEAEYTFYVPMNAPVEMKENELYTFEKTLQFEDGLLFRHADLDDDLGESYALLRDCAKEMDYTLENSFYNIYLDVYGDGVIDIFAPITKGA
ncbi:DUF5085 domain-containing protein [Bacillus sp. BGMRC 2118]|nr:DUF5085 domain-containing protein [Bacillus sp. BGMRC 2118]